MLHEDFYILMVLIVAKCNVNPNNFDEFTDFMIVLIVAKCNVNHADNRK